MSDFYDEEINEGEGESDSYAQPPRDTADFDSQPQNNTSNQSNTTAPPVSNVAGTSSAPPSAASEKCAIIGPTRSGKTALLAAIERACDLPSEDNVNIDFYPEPGITRIIREAHRDVLGKNVGRAASGKKEDFTFRICVTEQGSGLFSIPLEEDFYGDLSDSAGGYIFQTQYEEAAYANDPNFKADSDEMFNRIRESSLIILCVDAFEPNLRLLYERLDILLAETRVLEDKPARRLSWKEKLYYRFRPPPANKVIGKRARPTLKATRFLLLLTHIDQLCNQSPTPGNGRHSPLRMAQMLDPIAQARETLDVVLLEKIYKSLDIPNAKFAVGVCSPWGFIEEKGGVPFAGRGGQVDATHGEQGEEYLFKWKPFGVRDAIYFIATGKCRGTVQEVRREHLRHLKKPIKMNVKAKTF